MKSTFHKPNPSVSSTTIVPISSNESIRLLGRPKLFVSSRTFVEIEKNIMIIPNTPVPVSGTMPGTGEPTILLARTNPDSAPMDATSQTGDLSAAASAAEADNADAPVTANLPQAALDPIKFPLDSDHHSYVCLECYQEGILDESRYGTAPDSPEGREALRQAGFSDEQAQLGRALIIAQYDREGLFSHYVLKFDQPRTDANGQIIEYERPPFAPSDVDVTPSQVEHLKHVPMPLAWTIGSEFADSVTHCGMVGLNIMAAHQRFLRCGQKRQFIHDIGLDDIAQVAWIDNRKYSRLNLVFLEQNWGAHNGGPETITRTPALHALCQAIEKRGGTVLLVEPPVEESGIPVEAKAALFYHFAYTNRPLDLLFAGEPYSAKSNRRRLKAAWCLVK